MLCSPAAELVHSENNVKTLAFLRASVFFFSTDRTTFPTSLTLHGGNTLIVDRASVSVAYDRLDMDNQQHITTLKKLIQETEQSLAQMKSTVANLEERRKESAERHSDRQAAGEPKVSQTN